MAWTKIARVVLPQTVRGIDYGTPRDVMIQKGNVMVVKTRGHTGWICQGKTGYYSPQWSLLTGGNNQYGEPESHDLNNGYGTSGHRCTTTDWLTWLHLIAKVMGIKPEQLPQKLPRGGTLVWVEDAP